METSLLKPDGHGPTPPERPVRDADAAASAPQGSPFDDLPSLVWEALPSLVHDLRGPATALVAFSHLVEQAQGPEEGASQRDHVAALGANAELLASQLEALAFLAHAGRRNPADIGEVLRTIPGRLQKVLSRGLVSLNLQGETPDTPVERRSATVLVEGILRIILRETARGGEACLSLGAASSPGGVLTVTLDVTTSQGQELGGASALARTLAVTVGAAVAGADFMGLVLRTALEVLDATVAVLPHPSRAEGALVVVEMRCPHGLATPRPRRQVSP